VGSNRSKPFQGITLEPDVVYVVWTAPHHAKTSGRSLLIKPLARNALLLPSLFSSVFGGRPVQVTSRKAVLTSFFATVPMANLVLLLVRLKLAFGMYLVN
jgi:hypothetical protein